MAIFGQNTSKTADNINNWITENNVNQISQMATVIMTHKPGLNSISEIFKSTNEQTIINVTRAKFIQGNDLMNITPYGRRAIKVQNSIQMVA